MTFTINEVHVLGMLLVVFAGLSAFLLLTLSAAVEQLNKTKHDLKVAEDKRITAESREHASESSFKLLQKSYATACEENTILADRLEIICDLSDATKSIEDVVAAFNLKDKSQ